MDCLPFKTIIHCGTMQPGTPAVAPTGILAFKIRGGKYTECEEYMRTPGGSIPNRSASGDFVYTLMKVPNGYLFSQNPKLTGKRSNLFLNTEQLSMKELPGRFELNERPKLVKASILPKQPHQCTFTASWDSSTTGALGVSSSYSSTRAGWSLRSETESSSK